MIFLDEIDAWREADRALSPLYALYAESPFVETKQISRSALGVSQHRLDGGVREVWIEERLAAVAYVTRDGLNRSVLALWIDRSLMIPERA